MKPRRRTLPRPALLTVLVLLAFAIAATLAACGSGDSLTVTETTTVTGDSTDSTSSTTDSTSTTTDSTSTSTEETTADGPVRDYEQFQSPSKNIGCVMFDGGARCDAKSHQWDAGPAPGDCPLDYGDGLQVSGNGKGEFVCAGDTTLGAGPVLEYGESSEVKGATCVSAEDGITCTNASGAGFFISIQKYEFIG